MEPSLIEQFGHELVALAIGVSVLIGVWLKLTQLIKRIGQEAVRRQRVEDKLEAHDKAIAEVREENRRWRKEHEDRCTGEHQEIRDSITAASAKASEDRKRIYEKQEALATGLARIEGLLSKGDK